MDVGILAWIIPIATLFGGAIGWFSRQYRQYRATKREAALDAGKILNDKKALVEEMLNEIDDDSQKEELRLQLDEVNTALLGLHSARLRRTLKAAGLPPEEALIADGLSQLQPQQVEQLKGEIAELQTLPQPDSIRDLLTLGNAYYYAEQYEDAKDIYDRILRVNPDDPSILMNRGVAYRNLEKYDAAFADYNRSLELEPDDPVTLCNRGTALLKLERYDDALADYNRSLELRPDHPATLYNLACLFSLWGKTDDALNHLEKAIDKDKKYREMAKTDKDFDNIRSDPHFKKLMESD